MTQASSNLLVKLAGLPQASQQIVRSQAVEQIMQSMIAGSAEAKQEAVKGLAVIATNPIMDQSDQVSLSWYLFSTILMFI